MSNRRVRTSRITEEEINELLCKLETLLQEIQRNGVAKVKRSTILKETCDCIKSLRREVDDLSEKLSQLLKNNGFDDNGAQAELFRRLLSQ